MALVLIETLIQPIPPDAQAPVVFVLALGSALSCSFIGGSAAASGHISIPFAKSHPIGFSVGGGIAVLVVVMVVGAGVFRASGRQQSRLITGTDTIFDAREDYARSSFSFSTPGTVGWDSPISDLGVSNVSAPHPPIGPVKLFIPHDAPPFDGGPWDKGAKGGVLRMSKSRLSDVTECPTDRYAWHWVPASVDDIFCVMTRDGGHFAKIRILKIDPHQITFMWVYQPSGSPSFL